MIPALETIGLVKRFGALIVANGIDFRLDPGARHALIGPNGAGKTTFINLISGRLTPSSGRVRLDGADITGLPEPARVRRGLGRTFQINALFPRLTALETVSLAIGERMGTAAIMSRLFGTNRAPIEEAYVLLEEIGLASEAGTRVAALPYGKQRLVEIAIALALKPKVLLLDEPAAGVPGAETGLILQAIARLPASTAVLLIDHDMELVFRFAKRITVLARGAILAEGTPAEIAANPAVREIYLGERAPHG